MIGKSVLHRLKMCGAASLSLAIAGVGMISVSAQASPIPAPSYAAAVGYTVNTFQGQFWYATVDMLNTGASKFEWYPWNFFSTHAKTAALKINGDSSITLSGDTTGPNGEVATATPAKNAAKFVGTAFGGGGYFEATFKFNPAQTLATNYKGWPSFWAMSLEHLATSQDQWTGAVPGYMHFAEADFFEYDTGIQAGRQSYGGNMHDWSGIYQKTCGSFCDTHLSWSGVLKTLPQGIDLTQYHKYGYLWVPATKTALGYAQYYFDGVAIGAPTKWSYYDAQAPGLASPPWTFGVMDTQHLVIILGTGVSEPMTIYSVNVWQASYAKNLTF